MKVRNLLVRMGIVLFIILGFASCDEDFSNLDTDIIGGNFSTEDTVFSVKAYSKLVGGIQTSDHQTYKLGVYKDPVYGTTYVDLVGQVVLSQNNPTFPNDTLEPILEKVILTIPYFSDSSENSEGETEYTLDSIYGNQPINISIYESNYFLRDFDPNSNFEDPQLYYSNQGAEFEASLGTLLTTVEDFIPSNEADEFIIEDLDTLSINPGFNIDLPVDFFQEKIIDQEGEEVLLNNNNFKNYFRGLYFKVDQSVDDGNMFLFELDDAKVTLYYSSETTSLDDDGNQNTNDDDEIIRVLDSYDLTLTGINVNAYSSNIPAPILAEVSDPNTEEGEERLYLQGGEGIATIIELFTGDDNQNGIDDLEELRDREWLINEANIILYVDQDQVTGGNKEPERILIFDTKNNSILADYQIDLTSNFSPINAITEHLGRLERGSDDNGEFYKIKLTAHVSNLINRDSSNVKLGLVVSQNVSYIRFFETENPLLEEETFDFIPGGDIVSPEGTVLHGNLSENIEKRLKMQLFYTEPD